MQRAGPSKPRTGSGARVLEEAGFEEGAGLASGTAAAWTHLAEAFREASEQDRPPAAQWRRIGELSRSVLEAEEALWEQLAAAA